MEKYIVMPSNLYGRFADDIYSRRKIRGNVLFNWLNNYPPNIKLSIELSPGKFLDTKLTNIVQKYHPHRTPKLQNAINKIQLMAIFFIVQKEFHQTWTNLYLQDVL